MTYEIKEESGCALVILTGEIDLYKSPVARLKILSCLERGKPVLVDLSAVEYIDSSGIASLVEGYQLSRKKNLAFGLVGVSTPAMNVLQLARLDKVFPIFNSIEDFSKPAD